MNHTVSKWEIQSCLQHYNYVAMLFVMAGKTKQKCWKDFSAPESYVILAS